MCKESNDIEHRICVACESNILINGYICKICGTYQDWHKHLSSSSTLLALVIALISVSSFAIPQIKKRALPYADIKTSPLDIDNSRIRHPLDAETLKKIGNKPPILYFLATNYGERPWVVGGVAKFVRTDTTMSLVSQPQILKPNDSVVLKLGVEPDLLTGNF